MAMQGINCVKGEIHNVLTVLRLNPPRFDPTHSHSHSHRASPSHYQSLSQSVRHSALYNAYYRIELSGSDSNPLIRSLKDLYDRLEQSQSLSDMPCVDFLAPFLSVIDSQTTDIFTTAAALHSVHKFLVYGLLNSQSLCVGDGLNACVSSVIRCSFDVRDREDAEIVTMRILDTLMECMRIPVSHTLSNQSVIDCINQCLTVRARHGASKLLKRYAENTLMQMVLLLFARLPTPPNASSRKGSVTSTLTSSSPEPDLRFSSSPSPHHSTFISHGHRSDSVSDRYISDYDPDNDSKLPNSHSTDSISITPSHTQSQSLSQSFYANGYGIPALQSIFSTVVELINPNTNTPAPVIDGDADRILGLRLIRTVLETGGQKLNHYNPLILVIQDKLCKYLLQLSQSQHLFILSLILRIVYDLFSNVKSYLKIQLEVFFVSIHLRIGESANSSEDQRELVMESLVEFCREPSLIVGLYRNYDCELGCTDLFQDLCKFLASRSSLTHTYSDNGNDSVTRSDCLAMEAMIALVNSISKRFCENISVGVSDSGNNIARTASPASRASPALNGVNTHTGSANTLTVSTDDDDMVESSAEEEAQLTKTRADKKLLTLAANKFNAEGVKSFKYLQSLHVLSDPLTPDSIINFIRTTPALDKKMIGDFLGGVGELNQQCLAFFATTFKFDSPSSQTIDDALRQFLESFQLPGEAQMIARVIERFAECYYQQCPGPLVNSDAAYVLAYSVIMLNTDAHNNQVTKKMTKDEFVRNLRGINGGSDLPYDYLSTLYDSIVTNEIKLTSQSLTDLTLSGNDSVSDSDYHSRQWNRVIQSSKHSKFQTRAPRGYGRDMFLLVWQSSIAMFEAYLNNRELHSYALSPTIADYQPDSKLLTKVLNGLTSFAKICHVYQLFEPFNSLVISLCRSLTLSIIDYTNATNTSSDSTSVAVAYGKDRRARLLTLTLFVLIADHGSHSLYESWTNIVNTLLHFHSMDLLPVTLTQLEDFRDSNGRKLESMRNVRRQGQNDNRRAGGGNAAQSRFSYLVSFLFTEEEVQPSSATPVTHTGSDTESDSGGDGSGGQLKPLTDNDWLLLARQSLTDCELTELFQSTKHFSSQSLAYLIRALFTVSSQAWTSTNTDTHTISNSEESSVFALERLADIIEWNASRLNDPALKLWSSLYDHCFNALTHSPAELTFYVERLAVNVLRFSVRLLPPHCLSPSVNANQCLSLLSLLLSLSVSVLASLSQRITTGLSIFIQTQCESLSGSEAWATLVKLLLAFKLSGIGAHSVFQSFLYCIENVSNAENFQLFVQSVYQFSQSSAPSQSPSQSQYVPITVPQVCDAVDRLHRKLSSPTIAATVRPQFWLLSLKCMTTAIVSDSRPLMRRMMMDILTKVLLTADYYSPNTGAEWLKCLEQVLMPCVKYSVRFDSENESSAILLTMTQTHTHAALSPSSAAHHRTTNHLPRQSSQSHLSSSAAPASPYNLHEKSINLLFQTFLRRLELLIVDMQAFAPFWTKFLTLLTEEILSLSSKQKLEMLLLMIESLKNLLFIMTAWQVWDRNPAIKEITKKFALSLKAEWREMLMEVLEPDMRPTPAPAPAKAEEERRSETVPAYAAPAATSVMPSPTPALRQPPIQPHPMMNGIGHSTAHFSAPASAIVASAAQAPTPSQAHHSPRSSVSGHGSGHTANVRLPTAASPNAHSAMTPAPVQAAATFRPTPIRPVHPATPAPPQQPSQSQARPAFSPMPVPVLNASGGSSNVPRVVPASMMRPVQPGVVPAHVRLAPAPVQAPVRPADANGTAVNYHPHRAPHANVSVGTNATAAVNGHPHARPHIATASSPSGPLMPKIVSPASVGTMTANGAVNPTMLRTTSTPGVVRFHPRPRAPNPIPATGESHVNVSSNDRATHGSSQ